MEPNLSNRLLDSLSPASYDLIAAHTVPIDMPLRMPMYGAEERPMYAYLPLSGFASVTTATADGGMAEVGIIGRGGLVVRTT